MMDEEIKEWCGLTKADLLTYLSFGMTILGCFLRNIWEFTPVFVVAVISGIYSMRVGMPPKANVSRFTNLVKIVTYPLIFGGLVTVMLAKYLGYFLLR